jgi:hypothetical protein
MNRMLDTNNHKVRKPEQTKKDKRKSKPTSNYLRLRKVKNKRTAQIKKNNRTSCRTRSISANLLKRININYFSFLKKICKHSQTKFGYSLGFLINSGFHLYRGQRRIWGSSLDCHPINNRTIFFRLVLQALGTVLVALLIHKKI